MSKLQKVGMFGALAVVLVLGSMASVQAAEVTGTVQAVDPAGKSVTLDNGTTLMIPATAKVDRKALAPGAEVKASYEEKGGQKVASSIQVAPK
jgi:Cu/Ag efflux protein CusF